MGGGGVNRLKMYAHMRNPSSPIQNSYSHVIIDKIVELLFKLFSLHEIEWASEWVLSRIYVAKRTQRTPYDSYPRSIRKENISFKINKTILSLKQPALSIQIL